MALFDLQNNPLPWESSRTLGSTGERMAAEYLAANGYRLVLRNFKVPIGRNTVGSPVTGEIDIIALEGDLLCFIEVKTRSSTEFAGPLASVDLRKQRQIIRAARAYRRTFAITDMRCRYDVVTVLLTDMRKPVIEVVKGFWNETKFKKRRWAGDL